MTRAVINYAARTDFRQRYYANDHSRDTVVIDGQPMEIADGRLVATDLDAAGFKLVPHLSKVSDFQDREAVAAVHPQLAQPAAVAVALGAARLHLPPEHQPGQVLAAEIGSAHV